MCVKVYDGDTIKVVGKLQEIFNGESRVYNIRICGIDTPEIKTKNEKEKELGIKTRDYLSDMILDKEVKVCFKECDKYGRFLADIYIGDINITEHLVDLGYAHTYDGGKKESW